MRGAGGAWRTAVPEPPLSPQLRVEVRDLLAVPGPSLAPELGLPAGASSCKRKRAAERGKSFTGCHPGLSICAELTSPGEGTRHSLHPSPSPAVVLDKCTGPLALSAHPQRKLPKKKDKKDHHLTADSDHSTPGEGVAEARSYTETMEQEAANRMKTPMKQHAKLPKQPLKELEKKEQQLSQEELAVSGALLRTLALHYYEQLQVDAEVGGQAPAQAQTHSRFRMPDFTLFRSIEEHCGGNTFEIDRMLDVCDNLVRKATSVVEHRILHGAVEGEEC